MEQLCDRFEQRRYVNSNTSTKPIHCILKPLRLLCVYMCFVPCSKLRPPLLQRDVTMYEFSPYLLSLWFSKPQAIIVTLCKIVAMWCTCDARLQWLVRHNILALFQFSIKTMHFLCSFSLDKSSSNKWIWPIFPVFLHHFKENLVPMVFFLNL